MVSSFYNCLTKPFLYPPVRAGFGTLVGTQIHTAYLRSSFTTASDGSFALFVLPNPNNLFLYTVAGLNTAPSGNTSNFLSAANTNTLNQLMNSSRTLAMGLRLLPMIPATSVPGIIMLGCGPRCGLPDVIAANNGATAATNGPLFNKSVANISQLPYLREHMARPGGVDYFEATWRPTDNKEFEFSDSDAANVAWVGASASQPFYDGALATVAGDTQGSFLVATGQGLPASTTIYFEVVLHLEATSSTDNLSTVDATNIVASPSLASSGEYSSMESLYRSFLSVLPPVDQVISSASSVMSSPMIQHAARRYVTKSLLGIEPSGYTFV